jgi:hypothetical protein
MIGIILSSKLVESTLKAQFGEILPIELPVQNKSLLFHQIESLQAICDSIYITSPLGYKLDSFNDIPRIELESNLTLIQVLGKISEKFDLNQRIFIYYGDSLFQNIGELESSNNYFFVQKPIHQYVWGFADEKGLVPAGGIIISIKELKYMLSDCSDFDTFAKNILQSSNIESFSDFEWLDFGHTLTFYNSRKRFLESRSFNKITQNGGYVTKSSKDVLKMWSEFNWLKSCKEKLPANVPYVWNFSISNGEACYSIEYINHPPLSDIFVFGKISETFFIKILESIKRTLLKIRSCNFETPNYIEINFLAEKLLKRKKDIIKITEILNGDTDFVKNRIEENIEYFSNKKFEMVPIHGDLCFSNILFDFSTFEPILIDPRGYISDEVGFSMYGPDSYDYYKLAHSYVIGYDFLIAGKEYHQLMSKTEIKRRLKVFCELFNLDKNDLKMGLMNLFLSMLPLHNDSTARQESFLNTLFVIQEI